MASGRLPPGLSRSSSANAFRQLSSWSRAWSGAGSLPGPTHFSSRSTAPTHPLPSLRACTSLWAMRARDGPPTRASAPDSRRCTTQSGGRRLTAFMSSLGHRKWSKSHRSPRLTGKRFARFEPLALSTSDRIPTATPCSRVVRKRFSGTSFLDPGLCCRPTGFQQPICWPIRTAITRPRLCGSLPMKATLPGSPQCPDWPEVAETPWRSPAFSSVPECRASSSR